MLPQQFQQPEMTNKFNAFMEKAGWPIVTIVCTMIATLAGLVWVGSIHILNFNWLMLVLGIIIVLVAIFSVYSSHRTKRLQQSKYEKDLAALRKEFHALQRNFTDMAEHEFNRLNSMFVGYTVKNAEEQNERLEEMRKQLIEKIVDAENGMDSSIKNAQTIFSSSVKSYEIAVNLYSQQLVQTVKRVDGLEEQLRKISLLESEE